MCNISTISEAMSPINRDIQLMSTQVSSKLKLERGTKVEELSLMSTYIGLSMLCYDLYEDLADF